MIRTAKNWQGELKRIVTISWLLLAFSVRSYGQLGRIDGQLRYEHHYQDFLYGDNLTTVLVKNPVLDLRMRGSVLSPRILAYSLFSSLNVNFITTNSDFFSYSSTQYSWNRYNLILSVLPYSPVKLTLAARENAYDLKSESDYSTDHSADRQQEQRAEISVHQIAWLPTLSLSYVRNRSFAAIGFPYDVVNQTLTFTATGATDTTGSYGLTATMVDLRDRLGRGYDRFFTMQFSAARALSEKHGVTINSDYEKYTGYSVLAGSVVYSGVVTNRLRVSTALSGSTALSTYAQSRSISLSQSASYLINQNFQCGLGVSGFLGNSAVSAEGGRKDMYKSWATSGNVQHRRSLAGMIVLNALTLGYSEQRYAAQFHTFTAALSNTISRQVGLFSLNGNYNLSYMRVRNSAAYDVVDNTAALTASGILPRQIQSQTNLRYRDNRYPGEEIPYRNQRSLFLTQRFDGSFVYAIPFTLGLSGSANWFITGLIGHTYAWSVAFASPSFFVRRLSVSYVYSRSYDPYYQREVPEHNGSLAYQWRAISFTSRFRYATLPVRVREISFSIARPF